MERRSLLAGMTLAVAAAGAARAGAPGNMAQAFAAALSSHDLNEFAALFADDYVQHQTSAAVQPQTAGLSAKQATLNYFAARLAALPDLQVTADPVVVADDMVAANFTYTGTHKAPYFGIPPSGKRVTFNSCDIFGMRQGLIAAHWGAADIAGLLKQLRG
jgi:steroid delta-isomerase-like uncharacterized protein